MSCGRYPQCKRNHKLNDVYLDFDVYILDGVDRSWGLRRRYTLMSMPVQGYTLMSMPVPRIHLYLHNH